MQSCARISELESRFFAKSGAARARGTITGLTGQNLTLSVNGEPTVIAGSPVEFTTTVPNGESYRLAITAQPLGPGQSCVFTSATTGVASNSLIPFTMACSTGTNSVAGTVTGLTGSGLQLQINGGETISVTGGNFTFATRITDGQAYNVQVKVHPTVPIQVCTPEYNVGIITGADVTNVSILCSTTLFGVGGYVNGLATGESVVLQVNGGHNTTRSSDGFFLFPSPLADQTHYDVTVLAHPTGKTCSVQSGSGIVDGRGSYATYVQCSAAAWTVSGIVTGLSGGYVTLVTSAGEYKPVVSNGAFSFTQKFATGSAYAVEVFRNPVLPAQSCTVMNGTGSNISADVGSISVLCSPTGYTIGGSVTGLTASGLVLRLNGTTDVSVPVGATSYTFPGNVASGGTYTVAIAAQPAGLKCTVTPGTASGLVTTANITGAAVTCQTGYTVGGIVTGLSGTNLVLRNSVNGTNSDFVISSGSFTFPELLVNGDTYSVQVLNHPESPYQTCGISNSGGTVTTANITNVGVSCSNVTVQFQAASGNAAEANATMDIPITITPASARPLNLALALAAGTAAAGVDFNFLTPAITVPVGATSVNAQIQVFDDSAYEPDETVIINLTGVDKAALGTPINYTHTITNNDGVTGTKLVVTNSGNNFTAGGTTSITVQVQDASNNLATTDNSTQITFTPTASGRINAVTTGTGDGSYGVAGGAETITVNGGVATVTIGNLVAETFQIAVTNSAALTNPANISLTANVGSATQVVITSPAPDTTAGGSTSLTVQIQDANGNLVTGATTQVTFSPTLAGTVSGVTTGAGDGSYGIAGGPETITVSGGIATITLTNNTAQTFQIVITNNGGLSNPANDSVTISPAVASQVVLTSSGANFITGGTTSLTVQVQDSLGNLRISDSSTQITFSPTNSGRVTAVGTGTGDGSYGVAGGAETVTVAGGVATVNIGDSVSETFQVAFTNNAGLTNPSPRSLTASNSATQVAITQAGGSFLVGNSTTLTVQVQTSGGSLVTGDNTTQITFTPTNSGRVTGVTTGTGDGSYGVVAGAETVTVAGGIATVTLSDSVVETFAVAITNNAALTNPANDSITVNGASGAVVTKAEYFDIDHNGKIDRVKITFDKNVDETTLASYNVSGTDVSTQLLIAGYTGVTMRHNQCIDQSYPTNGNCTDSGELTDTTTNNIVWLQFTEGSIYDTGAAPDITGVDVSLRTTAAQGSCYIHTTGGNCNTQSAADFGTGAVAEEDKAPPVFVAAWSDPIIDAWQLRLQLSEAVDLSSGVAACSGTVTNAAFTYNNVSGASTSALRTDFADNDGCDSTNGNYYVIPRVNARFTYGDLGTDTIALASTFYDTLGQGTISTTKTIGYDPNLELYYPMDADLSVPDTNSVVHDVSGKGRNGAGTNVKLVRDMSESNYQAYKFDGLANSTIIPTGYKGIQGSGARTFAAWVKMPGPGSLGFWLFRQVTTGAGSGWTMYMSTSGTFSVDIDPAGQNFAAKYLYDGGWHHLAATYSPADGTTNSAIKLYVDGNAVTGTPTGSTAINSNNTVDMKLGLELSRATMDEARIYSRALTATEIKKLAVKVPGGLVAQYPLEPGLDVANNTSTDVSGNGNDLTIGSSSGADGSDPAPSFSRYFSSGTSTSYTFVDASNDYMKKTTSQISLTATSFTAAGWVKRNGTGTGIDYITSVGVGSSAPQRFQLMFDSADTVYCSFHIGNALQGPVVTDLNWHHVACTYDQPSKSRTLYIDGSKFATDTAGADLSVSTLVVIGAAYDGSAALEAKVNDVRYYNRALTAGEVKALATELDRGLVAYYPLDDAAATAKDYSGSGNDLTAVNGPTYVNGRDGLTQGAYNFVAASSQYLTRTGFTNLPTASNDRTMCGWKKLTSPTGSWQMAIDYGTFANNNASGLAVNNQSVPAFGGRANDLFGTLAASYSAWYNHCVTMQSNAMKLYVNGNLETSATMTGLNTGTTALRLGASLNTDAFLNGTLDDVRIYNRALSLAEIRELSGFFPAHAANLAVWYDASRIGDTGNVNPADGSDMGLWSDLSLNNRFADKGGASSGKPKFRTNVINGLPVIRFAVGQRMDVNNFPRNLNTTAHTQLVTFRASGGSAGAVTSQVSGANIFLYNAGPVLQTGIGGSSTNSNTAYTDNVFVIAGLSYANPAGTFYRNGLTDGTFSKVAASNTNGWRLSDASSALNGDIAEMVIYDRVLTAEELEKISCYYNKKYAIAVSITCD